MVFYENTNRDCHLQYSTFPGKDKFYVGMNLPIFSDKEIQ